MKPVLLWPLSTDAIAVNLNRLAGDFTVIDTNNPGDLGKLSHVKPHAMVLDPFPQRGMHYAACLEHIRTNDRCHHVVGLERCQSVLRAQSDPSLARASVEELLLALGDESVVPRAAS